MTRNSAQKRSRPRSLIWVNVSLPPSQGFLSVERGSARDFDRLFQLFRNAFEDLEYSEQSALTGRSVQIEFDENSPVTTGAVEIFYRHLMQNDENRFSWTEFQRVWHSGNEPKGGGHRIDKRPRTEFNRFFSESLADMISFEKEHVPETTKAQIDAFLKVLQSAQHNPPPTREEKEELVRRCNRAMDRLGLRLLVDEKICKLAFLPGPTGAGYIQFGLPKSTMGRFSGKNPRKIELVAAERVPQGKSARFELLPR